MVKHLSTMLETRIWSLGWEDPLEKEMAAHSSILAWKIPWTSNLVGYRPWGRKESDTTGRLLSLTHSAYKLNKQGDNIQPWCPPFPIWNQSVVESLSILPVSLTQKLRVMLYSSCHTWGTHLSNFHDWLVSHRYLSLPTLSTKGKVYSV